MNNLTLAPLHLIHSPYHNPELKTLLDSTVDELRPPEALALESHIAARQVVSVACPAQIQPTSS